MYFRYGFILMVLAAFIIGGCATTTPATTPQNADQAETTDASPEEVNSSAVTEVLWWMPSRDMNDLIVDVFVDSFNDTHDDVQLKVEFIEDYDRTTQTAVQAGAGPDIIQLGGPGYAIEYWAAEQIVDMSTYAEQYSWDEKILPWALEAGKIDGKLISLPLTMESDVLFYNKTALEEAGLEPPTNLAEVEAICETFVAQGSTCFSHFFDRNRWHFGSIWIHYVGADLYREALVGERPWDDPLFVDVVTMFDDWVKKGWVSYDLPTYYSLTSEDHWANFCQGLAPLNIEGTWGFRSASNVCPEAGTEWDWVTIPSLREGVEPVWDLSIGESLAVNVATQNPDAAAQVLDWIYSDKKRVAQLIEASNFTDWVLPLNYTQDDFSADQDERYIRYLNEFAGKSADGKIGYTIWTYWPPKAKTWAETEMAQVHNGEMTPKEFLTEFQAHYAAEASETKLPVPPETSVDSPE